MVEWDSVARSGLTAPFGVGGGLVCFPRSTARFTCPDSDLSIAFLFAALTVTYLSLHASRVTYDSIA